MSRWRPSGWGRLIFPAVYTILIPFLLPAMARAAGDAVTIRGFAYGPQAITVHVGDTVTWTNEDADPHTATADDKSFDSGTLGAGQSARVTFTTVGTFKYTCTFHPEMTGTVVVAAVAAAPATDVAVATTGSRSADGPPAALLISIALLGAASWLRRPRRVR